MTDQELHALEVELDEYGTISKSDALRLIAEVRRQRVADTYSLLVLDIKGSAKEILVHDDCAAELLGALARA